MKQAFEILMDREHIKERMSEDIVFSATVKALYNFIKKGGKLEDLPWFALAKTDTPLLLA